MKRSKLKKRLRKKYHVGEYTEYGFNLIIHTEKLNEDDLIELYDTLFQEIEKRNMYAGGGGDEFKVELAVTSESYRYPVTIEKAKELSDFVLTLKGVKNVYYSPLVDAWNLTKDSIALIDKWSNSISTLIKHNEENS